MTTEDMLLSVPWLLLQAQVLSQITIVVLLLQYALAPKMAEAMRQRAIMLCRAFTTTEAQRMKSKVRLLSGVRYSR